MDIVYQSAIRIEKDFSLKCCSIIGNDLREPICYDIKSRW